MQDDQHRITHHSTRSSINRHGWHCSTVRLTAAVITSLYRICKHCLGDVLGVAVHPRCRPAPAVCARMYVEQRRGRHGHISSSRRPSWHDIVPPTPRYFGQAVSRRTRMAGRPLPMSTTWTPCRGSGEVAQTVPAPLPDSSVRGCFGLGSAADGCLPTGNERLEGGGGNMENSLTMRSVVNGLHRHRRSG